MLESSLEKHIVDYAKRRGWWMTKIKDMSCNGAPDRRMICAKTGRIIFVEIKQIRGRLSEGQKEYHKKLKAHHQTVWIVDSITLFREKLDDLKRKDLEL